MAESLLSIKLAAKLAQSYIRQLTMERTITMQRETILAQSYIRQLTMERTITMQRETIPEKARLNVTLETLVKELEDRLRERTNDKS
jgi:hypothetical protein